MHIPRSPRVEGHIAAANHQYKSSLRDIGSSNAHKDLKVRFTQADEVKEFESGPAAAPITSPSIRSDVNSVPNTYYWTSEYPLNSESMQQSTSPSCSGAAAQPQPVAREQAQAQQQQYPAAPYGYYYNPYAYAQYAQMGAQGWPPQQVEAQPDAASAAPAQPVAAPNEAAPRHDPKRMQMMARSVSITVNPPHQDGSSLQIPGGVGFGHAGVGAMMQPPPGHMPAPHNSIETEEQEETRLLKWARRRLLWSCLHRSFKAWTHICEDRWWKTQIALRDQQAQLLAAQIRHFEFRPVRYIRRYKLKHLLKSWASYALRKRNKKIAMQRADAHAVRALGYKAFARWAAATEETCKEEIAEHRADLLHARHRKRLIIVSWKELVGNRARKEALVKEVQKIRSRWLMKMVTGSWAYLTRYYRSEKISTKSYANSILNVAFTEWRERVWNKKLQIKLIENFHLKHAASLQQWAFYVWLGFAEGRRARSAHEFHSQLSYEVERLRQENERLARVVDSGDWGRDRVAELTQAGQVLQQERDALIKLVESLPGNRPRRVSRSSTVQNNAESSAAVGVAFGGPRRSPFAPPADSIPSRGLQASEIASKTAYNSRRSSALNPVTAAQAEFQTESMTAAAAVNAAAQTKRIPQGEPNPAPLPANLRAKMNLRAGSSFNALVRALKQDLLTSGALKREPDAAFAIDKVIIT
jgi:hypothetical protein